MSLKRRMRLCAGGPTNLTDLRANSDAAFDTIMLLSRDLYIRLNKLHNAVAGHIGRAFRPLGP